jgi:hypothetical protein
MKDRVAPRRIQDPVSIQRIETETLVYDERRHQAFCLNESSSVIWLLADGAHTVAEISAAASLQLGAPVSEDLVLFALEELRRDGLIESSSVAETAPVLSRRVMLRRLGVGGALLVPMIAAVLAPTAAQAYGCVDCSTSRASRTKRAPAPGVPSQ